MLPVGECVVRRIFRMFPDGDLVPIKKQDRSARERATGPVAIPSVVYRLAERHQV